MDQLRDAFNHLDTLLRENWGVEDASLEGGSVPTAAPDDGSSDDDSESEAGGGGSTGKRQAKRQAKSPAAPEAGKPGKVLAFAGDQWHADVQKLLTTLEEGGKLKVADLDQSALNALKRMPCEVALVVLGKVQNEKTFLHNPSAFVVSNCKILRNGWNIEDASSASDDDSSDDDS